jgi:nucleoid DNA-binding protein
VVPFDHPTCGTLTRSDLTVQLVARGVPRERARRLISTAIDVALEGLARDGHVKLRDFGVFEVVQRAARPARDLRTGEQVFVPERRTVVFRSSPRLRAATTRALLDKREVR